MKGSLRIMLRRARALINPLKFTALLLWCLVLLQSAVAAPPKRAEVMEQLKDIRLKIDNEEGRRKSLEREEKSLQQGVVAVEKELGSLQTQEEALRAELKRLGDELAVVEIAVDESKRMVRGSQRHFKDRLIAMYKMRRGAGQLGYLAAAISSQDFLTRAFLLAAVARYDLSKLEELSKEVNRLEFEEKKLSAITEKRNRRLDEVSKLESRLQGKKEEREVALREISAKKELQERSLEKLERSAKSLEALLEKLMGSEEVEVSAGEGLERARGRLPMPVSGKIVQRFGKQKHQEFSDMVIVKGLEIATEVGTKVRPVAPGKVVLSQTLPGFGNVVIVDHGKRYYTLYGRLASTLATVGTDVTPSSVLGLTGEVDYQGRNFYFELRLKGKAVDPMDYLAHN